MYRFMLAAIAIALPTTAIASDAVKLDSAVFVEREVVREDGKKSIVLEAPARVVPGDKLVFVLTYKNVGNEPASNFTVTNPLPSAVVFEDVGDESTGIVSVDHGRTWGRLGTLTVTLPDGSERSALPSDVTHIKWTMQRLVSAGAEGRLTFRGVVK